MLAACQRNPTDLGVIDASGCIKHFAWALEIGCVTAKTEKIKYVFPLLEHLENGCLDAEGLLESRIFMRCAFITYNLTRMAYCISALSSTIKAAKMPREWARIVIRFDNYSPA